MVRIVVRLKRLTGPARAGRLALFLLILVAVLSSSAIINSHSSLASSSTSGYPQKHPLPVQPSSISVENALPGTRDWLLPDSRVASTQIQAYASATSVSPGQQLTFYVSTQQAGIHYTVQIYRLGWYGGAGGRLMLVSYQLGQAQGYYDPSLKKLFDCGSCFTDPQTNLVEARWQPSFSVTIPLYWITGVYEAKFTDANGWQTAAPFEVRGNPLADYIVVIADSTTAAYNNWGGYSLYSGLDGTLQSRATKVSFDRPALAWRFGRGNGLPYEINAIRWMEQHGYDLSYISSVDLHEHPEQLLNHRAYISLGHDEYWSKEMRDGVENARNHGVGLAFFGANAAYWQMRYEPDSQGNPDRTIVCYKDAKRDPLYGKNNTLVTVQWRDPLLHRPENALIGIMYLGWIGQPKGYPWHMSPTASSPFLNGTGLEPGHSYGCDLVGYEWDIIFHNGATPPGLTVLGTSAVVSHLQEKETSNTTYYFARSGALVFASGSIYWGYALDNLRVWDIPNAAQVMQYTPCMAQSSAIPGIQILMEHVMSALLIKHHAGLTLPPA